MWADRLAFSHSERIWPGIGPRLVGGPKKSPRVITVLVLRPRYRFLPRYHPSSVVQTSTNNDGPWPTSAHILFSLLLTISRSHFLSYFLFLITSYSVRFHLYEHTCYIFVEKIKYKVKVLKIKSKLILCREKFI